jgi:ferrous iron transport protein B
MEDAGLLPRLAFNMDSIFNKAGTNGKQALTMAMGFGCNACGVTGCRIFESEKERACSIITNNILI